MIRSAVRLDPRGVPALSVEQVNTLLAARVPYAPHDPFGYGISEHTAEWSRELFWDRYIERLL